MTTVDVLMPYYGDDVVMRVAVRSVLERTDPRLRLTVVDDGDVPGVPEWFAALGDERSEEHTSELQSRFDLVCRLLLEKKKSVRTIRLANVSSGLPCGSRVVDGLCVVLRQAGRALS